MAECQPSKTWRLVAIEVRIVPGEEQTLQSTCLICDCIRYPLSFNGEKIDQTVDRADYLR